MSAPQAFLSMTSGIASRVLFALDIFPHFLWISFDFVFKSAKKLLMCTAHQPCYCFTHFLHLYVQSRIRRAAVLTEGSIFSVYQRTNFFSNPRFILVQLQMAARDPPRCFHMLSNTQWLQGCSSTAYHLLDYVLWAKMYIVTIYC